jgi:plastocyanin
MGKVLLLLSAFLAFAGALLAQASVITLPAAASIVGGAPFFSDVRAFNTSYADDLTVTATYLCFLGTCPTTPARKVFTLSPRESRAFEDIVASASGFNAPNSAGAVEFSFPGASEQLVVTSRLFSTAPTPTVGMFIPGLPGSEAYALSVLTSVRNAGPGAGFRTNVGVFNPGDAPATVTFQIFDNGVPAGNPVPIPSGVPGHAGAQVNAIFDAAGVPTLSTGNAAIVVTASAPIFSYAAVIDNNTTDPYLIIGAEDQPVTPIATATPTPPGPTATPAATPPGPTATPTSTPIGTPTPPGPTATPTPPAGDLVVATSDGGTQFIDAVSGTSTSTITVGTTILWLSLSGTHSTTSGPCPPCTGDGLWDSGQGFEAFDHTFNQAGTFPYFCSVHGTSMTGTVIVNP